MGQIPLIDFRFRVPLISIPTFHFMFSWRSECHIQNISDTIKRISRNFRHASFPKNNETPNVQDSQVSPNHMCLMMFDVFLGSLE